jgi:epoxyqueuosine reductase
VIVSHPLVVRIQAMARDLGFSQIGIAGVDLSSAEDGLMQWLAHGFHGEMQYMATHGTRRARPAELVPGTVSVITARMDYLPRDTDPEWQAIEFDRLARPGEAIVSVYARGRDYHKVLRNRLAKLAERIAEEVGPFGHRAFTDSAPVLEAELASRSGQGWRGKHTLVLDRNAGSMFFLGEIYVDMALPPSEPVSAHCGSCTACIDVCPTQAIVAPGRLDARRCISYLTIEHSGPIPLGAAPADGQPHLRLRRLPADLPLEQVRQEEHAARLRCARRAHRAHAGRVVRLDRGRLSSPHRGQPDPPHRA